MKKYLLFIFIIFSTFAQADDDFQEFDEIGNTSTKYEWSFNGQLEVEQGVNVSGAGVQHKNTAGSDYILANRKFRVGAFRSFDNGGIYSKLDFNYDEVTFGKDIDVREFRLQYKVTQWLDLSLGRQVSTWGVADMIFINDLFPKNWIANFQGRDMEMLKDPSNSLRLTSYVKDWIFDFIYQPEFKPDTTPRGCRFGVFDPNSSTIIVNKAACGDYHALDKNGSKLKKDEIAFSIKRRIRSQEAALYFYDGYYKSPKGLLKQNPLIGYHPKLRVIGLSNEGQLGVGIISFEAGYYDSLEDKDGTNNLIENSTLKYLLGYKLDINANLSFGLQWYQEKMLKYKDYEASVLMNNSNAYAFRKKEYSNTFTTRITYKISQDTLIFSLFAYLRPQDKDSFTKFEAAKKINDNLKISTGLNIFTGKENYLNRDFGMLKDDDNVFIRLTISI